MPVVISAHRTNALAPSIHAQFAHMPLGVLAFGFDVAIVAFDFRLAFALPGAAVRWQMTLTSHRGH